MYELLSTMSRSQLSSLQRRIAPLLQFDIISVCSMLTSLMYDNIILAYSHYRRKLHYRYSHIFRLIRCLYAHLWVNDGTFLQTIKVYGRLCVMPKVGNGDTLFWTVMVHKEGMRPHSLWNSRLLEWATRSRTRMRGWVIRMTVVQLL